MKLYGNAIIVNSKFAVERPDAVKAFLSAYLRGLKETIRRPADAIDLTIKREDAARNAVELERLRMAIRDNILTPEVKADGYGTVDMARLEEAIAQLALTHTFKVRPKAEDVFDGAFLPPAADREGSLMPPRSGRECRQPGHSRTLISPSSRLRQSICPPASASTACSSRAACSRAAPRHRPRSPPVW